MVEMDDTEIGVMAPEAGSFFLAAVDSIMILQIATAVLVATTGVVLAAAMALTAVAPAAIGKNQNQFKVIMKRQ